MRVRFNGWLCLPPVLLLTGRHVAQHDEAERCRDTLGMASSFIARNRLPALPRTLPQDNLSLARAAGLIFGWQSATAVAMMRPWLRTVVSSESGRTD